MKYKLHLFIMYALSTTLMCTAMENNKSNILAELTSIKKPCFAQYLTDNRVVIASENTECHNTKLLNEIEVHIVNPINNEIVKEIKKITTPYSDNNLHLAVHPRKTKIALSYAHTVAIYNTETGKKEWCKNNKKEVSTSVFSPIDDSIFIVCNDYDTPQSTKIVKYNYVTNERYNIYNSLLLRPTIALHPTQNIMCAGNEKGKIFLYSLDTLDKSNLPWNEVNKLNSKPKTITSGYTEDDYQYNHDGSIIIANGFHDITIIAPRTEDRTHPCPSIMLDENYHSFPKYCPDCGIPIKQADYPHNLTLMKLKLNNGARFFKVAFYPESLILATLSEAKKNARSSYIVSYWDIQTQKCIYTTPLLESEGYLRCKFYYDLSFSPDKTKLLVTFEDKCLVLSVPLEIHKQTLPIYWILKNYRFDEQQLPYDLVQVILTTLHDVIKY